MSTFLENTKKFITAAATIAHIPGDSLAKLEKPDAILSFEVPVGSGAGSWQKYPGWRVQHSNVLGPYKGGIRFHPDANLDEVEALASLMTWKTSLMGLPFGGAKGAVRVDPQKLTAVELEELSRGYVRAVWPDIGPDKDIPAPDVGTSPRVLDWMVDEYARLVGHQELAAFTGKSVEQGGSRGREIATGFGGFVVLREFLKNQDSKFQILNSQCRVAIQGFGNVGANIAKILFENGFTVVAISDSRGALYEEEGIDIAKVLAEKEKTGIIDRDLCYAVSSEKMRAGSKCTELRNRELLTLPVDILIPAALENQITVENAAEIRAKVILEMANGPVTPEAEELLIQKGIDVIPDILANGGGVVGSYFEWVQSREGTYWNEEEVLRRIDEKMTEAFRNVVGIRKEYNVSWRLASYIGALTLVVQKMQN